MGLLEEFYKKIDVFKIKNDRIFFSYDKIDEDIVGRFEGFIRDKGVRYWAMRMNGKESNTAGDNYRKKILENLNKSCLMLLFVSRSSINSNGVKEEIEIVREMPKEKRPSVIFMYIEDTKQSDLSDEFNEFINLYNDYDIKNKRVGNSIIHVNIKKSHTDDEMRKSADEIFSKYFSCIADQIGDKYLRLRDSYKMIELTNDCVSHDCIMRTISDDIKVAGEVKKGFELKEVHLLTDEIAEYDLNTYSCTVIASNLLGKKVSDGEYLYEPDANGVKYYYYGASKYLNKAMSNYINEKLRGFIKKNKESRREVVRLIRREYSNKNNIGIFFEDLFDGLNRENFWVRFNVKESERAKADELFSLDDDIGNYKGYFTFRGKFRVPNEFAKWLIDTEYDLDRVRAAYKFINFLEKLLKYIKHNKEYSYEELERKIDSLIALRQFESWQDGYDALEEKQYELDSDFAMGVTEGLLEDIVERDDDGEKFPKLKQWIAFDYDENKNRQEIKEITVDHAMRNLHIIPVDEDIEDCKLSSSFFFYIRKNNTYDGGWYATGKSKPNGVVDTVVSYEIRDEINEYMRFRDVFIMLAKHNPNVRDAIKGSELLKIIDSENGGGN